MPASDAFRARSSRISTLNGWPWASASALPSSKRDLLADERVIGGDRLPHPALDRGEVVGRQRPGQLEVVVEPVVDRGPDPQPGAREQVEDRLGHHVRRRMAHRVDGRVRPRVEQLVRRAPVRGVEVELVLDRDRRTVNCCRLLFCHHIRSPGITRPLVPTGREVRPPAVPPAFASPVGPVPRSHAALTGGSRAGSPAAHGWCRRPGARLRLSAGDRNALAGCGRGVPRSSRCGGRYWTRTSDLMHVKHAL